MPYLRARTDQIVRTAVDAFLDGRRRAQAEGELVFATRNSEYRLVDGIVFDASDTALRGAELVGWLLERKEQMIVGPRWEPGARAILVDARRGRQIVVTSTTRLVGDGRASASPAFSATEPDALASAMRTGPPIALAASQPPGSFAQHPGSTATQLPWSPADLPPLPAVPPLRRASVFQPKAEEGASVVTPLPPPRAPSGGTTTVRSAPPVHPRPVPIGRSDARSGQAAPLSLQRPSPPPPRPPPCREPKSDNEDTAPTMPMLRLAPRGESALRSGLPSSMPPPPPSIPIPLSRSLHRVAPMR